ncbi:NAD(P)H-dependent oxidoreductase [Pseudovibrio flavus]|uniref:NAD(P)H-dependent oxidoreductase n=1 Tax=Pseudovibrio flavus TaxID=2529854 RepID=UPI00211CCC29|nr:homoserine dehydrogenase [Pseudovibrio flavus]
MHNIVPSGLAADLELRAKSGKPIRIGLIGCGVMGTDIVTQCRQMYGIDVAAIADIRPDVAKQAVITASDGKDEGYQIVEGSDITQAIEAGNTAICADALAICRNELIDVIVDATGKPAVGADIGLYAMQQGKHLVMMNVEADNTIGAYLGAEAKRLGVIYSLGAGDEPSSTIELIEFVTALGYPIVAAGKGKNNPLKIDATPDEYKEEADRRGLNPRMLVEFVDGSKTAIEMVAIANATGLIPDIDGMHGPSAKLEDLHKVLCPEADGGVLKRKGVVDYSIGEGVAPGVFVVAELAHPRLRERMNDLKMGPGPYYTFYRPYHLCSLEVPLTCARAVLYGKADMKPLDKPVAEVCAVAKRDLEAGERLDAIGEYTYRAWAMEVDRSREDKAVPCGLLENGTVLKPIKAGELLTYDNCKPDETSRLFELRKLQDEMVYGAPKLAAE